jgi:streptogramin lyase
MELTRPSATIGSLAALGVILLASPRAATAQTVATLAGAGTPGITDGRASVATFLFPAAVAVNANGDVYVADAAAQRVRIVRAADGVVRTLAGSGTIEANAAWVPGGDADGPGASAQFSRPLGIAVAPDGSTYVADAGNRSIRRIAPDGTVATFARGLGLPRQLALDRESRLYVADSARGIVRIDPDGRSTVLPLNVVTPYGIAIWEQGGTLTLFVADDQGIVMARDGAEIRIDRADRATPSSDTTEGEEPIGAPYQLAALDDHTVAYTDLRDEAVRMLAFEPKLLEHGLIASAGNGQMHRRVAGAVTLVAGSSRADAMMDGGGFADGAAASFDAPMGIAASASGELIVADAGNRRVRIVRGIDRGQRLLEDGALPPARDAPNAYRLLLAGPSGVWWDTTWPASIPGIIERDLAAARTQVHGPFEVLPARLIGADSAGYASYLDEVGDSHTVDAVVLMLNGGIFGGEDSPRWIAPTAAALRTMRERLARAHVALLVVVLPEPLELDPVEQTWRKVVEDALAPVLLDDDARWLEVVRQADVDAVDLFAVFRANLSSSGHRPLFGSDEAHLTPYGRSVAAHAISAALLRYRRWEEPR